MATDAASDGIPLLLILNMFLKRRSPHDTWHYSKRYLVVDSHLSHFSSDSFWSRASGTNRDDSDVDLIMEFSEPITLLTLSDIKLRLENILGLSVDVVHGPLRDSDILNISKEIEIYAA